jgi:predicted dehydrogenase
MQSVTRRTVLAGAAAVQAAEEIRLPRKVRIGLIGMDGHPGEILTPLRRLPDVELVAVAGVDAASRKRFAKQRVYDDYRKMLDSEQFDLVAVCNDNGARADAVLACAARKVHIIAEKPLAIEMADLKKVKDAVQRAGVGLSMLLPMRFTAPYLALRRAVESGEVGEVVQIAAQKSYKMGRRPDWFKKRASYGGTIAWIGIHMIDLMRWGSGREFTETFSYQGRVGFEDLGDMETVTATLFRLDNGGAGTLRMDYFRPETAPTHGDDRLRLAGTKGIVEYQASTGVVLMTRGAKPRTITELPKDGSVFVDFLESLYLEKPASLTAADIWRVNEITLLARDAAEQHRVMKL